MQRNMRSLLLPSQRPFSYSSLTPKLPPPPLGQSFPTAPLLSLDERSLTNLLISDNQKSLVVFIRKSCPHCQEELAILNSVSRTYQDKLRFVVVSLSSKEETERILSEKQIVFPAYLCQASEAKQTYGLTVVPAMFFLDEKIRIRYRYIGKRSLIETKKLINQFLQEENTDENSSKN